MQIDFIHSASAIGTWMVQKEYEIATFADWNLKVFLRYKLSDHIRQVAPLA